jgi:hypothetical protein
MIDTLRRGDFITITAAGRSCRAMVTLASANGRSLIVMYDGIVGGFVGAMPVYQRDDGTWIAIDATPIAITRQVDATENE